MISEEQKQNPVAGNKNELDDVLDQLAMNSPQSPEFEVGSSEKKPAILGSGDSKKIPSLRLMDQKPLIANVAPMKIKMNPIAEIESMQSSSSKSMQVVNDKEICSEGESSSDDDNSELYNRAMLTNKSFR